MKKETIAIFDMDSIAYRAAAVAEKKAIDVTHLPSNSVKRFKTRTEFKKLLKSKDIEFQEDKYFIEDVQIAQPVNHALQIVKSQVNKIKENVGATEMYGFIGKGDTNFRLHFDLPVQYKGQREDSIRPVHLGAAKQYAVDNYIGGYVEGIEVDDEVVIRWHELAVRGFNPVIISMDKDSLGCVGTKFYNWTLDEPEVIEVPAFGFLEYVKGEKSNKVNGLGYNFLMYQLLFGDDADNYHIRDLHGETFGAVSVVNYLNQATNVDELFALTEAKYKEWFGDEFTYTTHDGRTVTKSYKEILNMYFRLAYMHRKRNDNTSFYDLWRETA